jgi:hypothetical protein
MKTKIMILAIFVISMLSACDRRYHEGPAERAGRHIDNAADEVHDSAVRTGHEIKEEAHDLKDRVRSDDDRDDERERRDRF